MPTCKKHNNITGSGIDDSFLCVYCEIDRLRAELANLGELKQCEKAHTYNVKYHVLCPICTEHKLRRELEQVKRERDRGKGREAWKIGKQRL